MQFDRKRTFCIDELIYRNGLTVGYGDPLSDAIVKIYEGDMMRRRLPRSDPHHRAFHEISISATPRRAYRQLSNRLGIKIYYFKNGEPLVFEPDDIESDICVGVCVDSNDNLRPLKAAKAMFHFPKQQRNTAQMPVNASLNCSYF
jgi:hypothetical protein